jgi:hypothetical protein
MCKENAKVKLEIQEMVHFSLQRFSTYPVNASLSLLIKSGLFSITEQIPMKFRQFLLPTC